jgi:hypothetical protein
VVLVNDPKRVEGRRWHQLGKLLAPVKIGGEEVLSILAKVSLVSGPFILVIPWHQGKVMVFCLERRFLLLVCAAFK